MWILELEFDIICRLTLQENMFVLKSGDFLAFLLVEKDAQKHFKISCSDTHMS